MKYCVIAFVLLFGSAELPAETLAPFTSDGCSSFPDGTIKQQFLWQECCIQHDLAYWMGGSFEQRLEADMELKRCVENTGEPEIAGLMLAGVRAGGTPYLPTSYRWGYGWPYPRGYSPLTDEEAKEVIEKLNLYNLMINRLTEEFESKFNKEKD